MLLATVEKRVFAEVDSIHRLYIVMESTASREGEVLYT